MLKKIVAIAAGVLMVVLTMGPKVEAATGTISGTSCTSCVCFSCTTGAVVSCTTSTAWKTCNAKRCSIGVENQLGALGNASSGDVAAVEVVAHLQQVRFICRNSQGKQQVANAPHFVGDVAVATEDLVDPGSVQGNGQATSNAGITDDRIVAAVARALGLPSTDDLCPNKNNWTVKALVEQSRIVNKLWYDPDPANDLDNCVLNPDTSQTFQTLGCSLRDVLSVQCFAPAGAKAGDEFTYVGTNGRAPCNTVCHDDAGIVCDQNGLPQ